MAADENEKQSPFTRPGYIAAAVVVALIVLCAIILIIVNLTRGDSSSPPAPSTSMPSASPSTSTAAPSGEASICGLAGVELDGIVTAPPAATWAYEGTTAYPTSPKYGPGKTAAEGYRYCFQHSPTGALFMAANAVAVSSDESARTAWGKYVLGEGKFRDELLAQQGSNSTPAGTRIQISGFRMLNYDGKSASVDLAMTYSSETGTITVSGVYSLVWQDGDWKLSADTMTPLDVAPIPNVAGYTPWGS